jgi:hypothetical protein
MKRVGTTDRSQRFQADMSSRSWWLVVSSKPACHRRQSWGEGRQEPGAMATLPAYLYREGQLSRAEDGLSGRGEQVLSCETIG